MPGRCIRPGRHRMLPPFLLPPQGQPSEWALLKRHPSEDCFGVQLCGGYPDAMARCAQVRCAHSGGSCGSQTGNAFCSL